MGAKVLKKPKYLFNFENTKHISSPVGKGTYTLYKVEKDPETGLLRFVPCGESDRQAEMDLDAKGINLKNMLEQVEQGKLKRAPLVYGDTTKIAENMFDARKNAFAVANLWDNNPLLRSMYATKEDYKKDLANGVDIEKKINDFKDKYIATSNKALEQYKKEMAIKDAPKEEPKKEQLSKEVK